MCRSICWEPVPDRRFRLSFLESTFTFCPPNAIHPWKTGGDHVATSSECVTTQLVTNLWSPLPVIQMRDGGRVVQWRWKLQGLGTPTPWGPATYTQGDFDGSGAGDP